MWELLHGHETSNPQEGLKITFLAANKTIDEFKKNTS